MKRAVILLAACLAGCGSVHGPGQRALHGCRIDWARGLPAPDDRCTPGAYRSLSRDEACAHKQRPELDPNERRRIVVGYGRPDWSGRDGELDHRVPFFLGGTTDSRNLWPEPGAMPNEKDRLEFDVYDRVCVTRTMEPGAAVRIFLGDWRAAR